MHSVHQGSCWIIPVTAAFLLHPAQQAIGAETASHCAPEEKVIFSCRLEGSGKVLSLCASPELASAKAYLQYRFGAPGDVEAEFPARREKSLQAFASGRYFRAQVERRELSFVDGPALYTVFSNYEGEDKLTHSFAGITISEGKGEAGDRVTCRCSAPYHDNLEELDKAISPEIVP